MSRIVWTPDENLKVATRWVQVCERDHQDPLQPRSLGAVAKEAQLILDEDRQRPESSLSGVASLSRVLEFVDKLVTDQTLAKSEAEEAIRVAASIKQKREEELRQKRLEQPVPDPLPLTGSLEEIVRSFGQGIAAIVVGEIVKAINVNFKKEFPKLHGRAMSATQALPRILVVGPLGKQQPILEQAAEGIADLKFVSSEEPAQLVTMRGKSCAAAILWSNFMDHPKQNAARALFNSDQLKIISGGLETIKAAVQELSLGLAEAH